MLSRAAMPRTGLGSEMVTVMVLTTTWTLADGTEAIVAGPAIHSASGTNASTRTVTHCQTAAST